jgi:hypothetical protein
VLLSQWIALTKNRPPYLVGYFNREAALDRKIKGVSGLEHQLSNSASNLLLMKIFSSMGIQPLKVKIQDMPILVTHLHKGNNH